VYETNEYSSKARERIQRDCFGIWKERTILDALPDEAQRSKKAKSWLIKTKEG
jgi:hypothetical protein